MRRLISKAVLRARVARVGLAPCLLGVALTAGTLGALEGCSSTSSAGTPCETTFEGKCGVPCSADTTCATGLYCGPDGKCTADCDTTGAPCGSVAGSVCSGNGRCQSGTGFVLAAGGALSDASACLVDRRKGEGVPADLYIMNDQSHSMACPIPTGGDRWTAMKTALGGFLRSPDAAGLGVGIQYFGQGQGAGPGAVGASCNVADYEPADVEIAPLPGNADAVVASLDRHRPYTLTPTPAAIDGALAHARQWATAHPERIVSVVLATDGQPNACGNPADRVGSVAASVAKAYAGTPQIRTYVIGIVGGAATMGADGCQYDPAPPNQPDLDRVAKAGGTDAALMVDALAGDTAAEFLDALNHIRGAAVLGCQYVLPTTTVDGQTIDPRKVNVSYAPSDGAARALYQSPDVGSCDASAGGWYYDDPTTPTKILLCPATCNAVKADPKASIDVLLGCETEVPPVR
jgi:hypothetical protein